MDSTFEKTKYECIRNLTSFGVSADVCEFVSDSLECEHQINEASSKFLLEISNCHNNQSHISALFPLLQKFIVSYKSWSKKVTELQERTSRLPDSICLDPHKLFSIHSYKSPSTIHRFGLSLKEGETVLVTDASKPDKWKVKDRRGNEAYLPLSTCLIPSPHTSLKNFTQKLQVQLLTSWKQTVCKEKECLLLLIQPILAKLIISLKSSKKLLFDLEITRENFTEEMCMKAEQSLFETNVRLLEERMGTWVDGKADVLTLLKPLRNVENCLLNAKCSDASGELLHQVAEVDKVLLLHQAFKFCLDDRFSALRTSLRKDKKIKEINKENNMNNHITKNNNALKKDENNNNLKTDKNSNILGNMLAKVKDGSITPFNMRIRNLDRQALKHCQDKMIKYFEVKLTSTESTVVVEKTYTSKPQPEGEAPKAPSSRTQIDCIQDPRTMEWLTLSEAINEGVLRHKAGQVVNPDTGHTITIAEAISRGVIKMKRIGRQNSPATNNKTKETSEKHVKLKKPQNQALNPLLRIKRITKKNHYVIESVLNVLTDEKLTSMEARMTGILLGGTFKDTSNGEVMTLDVAIEKGLVKVADEKGGQEEEEDIEVGTLVGDEDEELAYVVKEVYDKKEQEFVSLLEAVRRKLIDTETGCYVDNLTMQRKMPAEAIRSGELVVKRVINPPQTCHVAKSNEAYTRFNNYQGVNTNLNSNHISYPAF